MVPALRAGAEHVGGDYRNSRLSHSAAAGVDDAAVIRRCAVTETPRPDPWASVRTWEFPDQFEETFLLKDEVDAARAADAARHQAEIESVRQAWDAGQQRA